MSSRAYRETITVLALTEGIGWMLSEVYKHRDKNKTIMMLIDRLVRAVDHAFSVWPKSLTREEWMVIEKRLDIFKARAFPEPQSFPVFSSFMLGVLSDLRDHLVHPDRRGAIDNMIAATRAIHTYFDRKGDKVVEYDRASEISRIWEELKKQ